MLSMSFNVKAKLYREGLLGQYDDVYAEIHACQTDEDIDHRSGISERFGFLSSVQYFIGYMNKLDEIPFLDFITFDSVRDDILKRVQTKVTEQGGLQEIFSLLSREYPAYDPVGVRSGINTGLAFLADLSIDDLITANGLQLEDGTHRSSPPPSRLPSP